MDVCTFTKRWQILLECQKEVQPEALLRPISEVYIGDTHVLKYQHSKTQGWAIAFSSEGVLVKAYDLEEITPYTFIDVRPHFVLPKWVLDIYNSDEWESQNTTSFKYGDFRKNVWEVPWLALEWLPIDAHSLIEPDMRAVHSWAEWYGCPELAEQWNTRIMSDE